MWEFECQVYWNPIDLSQWFPSTMQKGRFHPESCGSSCIRCCQLAPLCYLFRSLNELLSNSSSAESFLSLLKPSLIALGKVSSESSHHLHLTCTMFLLLKGLPLELNRNYFQYWLSPSVSPLRMTTFSAMAFLLLLFLCYALFSSELYCSSFFASSFLTLPMYALVFWVLLFSSRSCFQYRSVLSRGSQWCTLCFNLNTTPTALRLLPQSRFWSPKTWSSRLRPAASRFSLLHSSFSQNQH